MMKSYTTLGGAAKARPGAPIVRLLRDPEDIFVPVLALDTEVHVLTCHSPRGRATFAGAVSLQGIVDAELARQEIGHAWRGLRIVPDAANPNNLRITSDGDRHVCKVYGYTPEDATRKANAIMAALALVTR